MINKKDFLEKTIPFFNELKEDDKDSIISRSFIAEYKKNQVVHTKDSECIGLLLTISGNFRVYISAPNGRQITLFKLYERDICMLSASCSFPNLNYDVNLEAEEDSVAIILDSMLIKELSESYISVMKFLLDLTQDKLSQIMYVLEQTTFFSLNDRITDYLLEQSRYKNSKLLNITHEQIANEIGSSREVVSRVLKKFEKENMIKISRSRIKILKLQ